MKLNATHPLNQPVLSYIRRVKQQGQAPLLAAPDAVSNAYWGQGSHPDIVERVWDELGAALPEDSRCLVCGTPALVQPHTGIILAFCNGTTYCLRLSATLLPRALQAGVKTYEQWPLGGELDTQRDLGPTWVFGHWLSEEIEWCLVVYAEMA